MRILLDMNLPPRLAELFSNRGIEAKHWSFIGAPDASDKELMEYAKKHNYIVMTCDLVFNAILAVTHGEKPSIIQIRVSSFHAEAIIELILTALTQYNDDLEKGAVMTIDLKKARVRLLPL